MKNRKITKNVGSILLSILMLFAVVQPVAVKAAELPVTTKPVDIIAPSVPKSVMVTGKTATTVSFSWIPSTDNIAVTGYNLYSGTSLVATTMGTISNNAKIYILSKQASNTTYKFTIKARDLAGNLSAASNEVIVTTKPLVAPNGLKTTAVADTSVTLAWAGAAENGGVTSYNIYKGSILVGTTTGATTYRVTGLTQKTAYSFTVRAKDVAGKLSSASTPLTVVTNATDKQAPSTPAGLKATAITDKSVSLTWTASTDNVKVTGYNIYKGGILVTTTSGTTCNVNGLTAKTSYVFTVKAKDAAGNISLSSVPLSVTTKATDTIPPTAPTGLKVTAKTDTTVTLAWTASTDNVKVTGYNVYSGTTLVGTTSGTTYKVSGLTAATKYSFTVKAKDAIGNLSTPSAPLVVITNSPDKIAPTVPGSLKATAKTDTTVSLSWTASTDNIKVTGYNIYNGGILIGTSSSTSYKITKLEPNTKYSFTVKAKDAAGNLSGPSTALSVTTNPPDTTAPTAPSNLKSTSQTATSISLTWTASTDNIKVTGYNIYINSVLIGTTTGTTYTINALAAQTTYMISVKAKDAAGNLSVPSTVTK